LKLAEVTKESPDVILRAAGRSRLADQLLHLYGPVSVQLTDEEKELLAAYHGIRRRHAQLAFLAIGKAMDDIHHGGVLRASADDRTAAAAAAAAAATDQHSSPAVELPASTSTWPIAVEVTPRRHRRQG